MALASTSCARTSSPDVGTALMTLDAAALMVDWIPPSVAGLLADSLASPRFLFSVGRDSGRDMAPTGALTERFWGVADSGAGDANDGDGEP